MCSDKASITLPPLEAVYTVRTTHNNLKQANVPRDPTGSFGAILEEPRRVY
jgi:hypothetical protein